MTPSAAPPVDFGHRAVVVRRALGSARVPVRWLVVLLVTSVCVAALAVLGLLVGDFVLAPAEVLDALTGRADGLVSTVVLQWRLPRVLAAVVFGAALGVSGALFQAVVRNPLASPDVMGFSAGSFTGALVVLLWVGDRYAAVAVGSLVGGLCTAAAIYLLAYRQGVQGFRLVVVGIGGAALLGSVNSFLLLRAPVGDAMGATVWGSGSLNTITWSQTWPTVTGVVALLACTVPLRRALALVALGDDVGASLGVRVTRVRTASVFLGTGLIATVTAVAGPITFVSLVAPHVAKRLVGGGAAGGGGLAASAATGALLLVASDHVAHLVLPGELPVGLVTLVTGGAYLAWLVVCEVRRST